MTTASLLTASRRLLRDTGDFFTANIAADPSGTTQLVELPQENIDPGLLQVFLVDPSNASTLLLPGTMPGQADYVLYETAGQIWLTLPLQPGYQLNITGIYYTLVNNDDLTYYVQTAFQQHTHDRMPPVYLDTPDPSIETPGVVQQPLPEVEEWIVAIEAGLMFVWSEIVEAGHEFDIVTPDGVHVPRSQRFTQLNELRANLEEEREHLSRQLNVGLDRIEMRDLRRVSRLTNRLVPLYMAREFDDRSWPVRKLPEIDTGGAQKIVYRGMWQPGVQFFKNDLVDRDSTNRFVAVQNNINVDPLADTANSATPGFGPNWMRTTINTGWQGPGW
jgi:hypothetical protein